MTCDGNVKYGTFSRHLKCQMRQVGSHQGHETMGTPELVLLNTGGGGGIVTKLR